MAVFRSYHTVLICFVGGIVYSYSFLSVVSHEHTVVSLGVPSIPARQVAVLLIVALSHCYTRPLAKDGVSMSACYMHGPSMI